MKCDILRAPAKRRENELRTVSCAKEKGRFLSEEEFKGLFGRVRDALNEMGQYHEVIIL